MKSVRIIVAAGACVAVGALFGPTLATAAKSTIDEVIVQNEATDPVPVNVGNTPTVNVGNTPSVNVGNTPSVRVDNVATVAQAGTPVQFRGQLQFAGASFDESQSYAVPADKRLRIDHVTFHDLNRDVKVQRLALIAHVGDTTMSHSIVTQPQGTNGDVASQPMLAYSDPGSAVSFGLSLDQVLGDDSSTFFMYATFTGVLLDA